MVFAIQNGHYFLKDTSKQGTYVRIGQKKKTERIELVPNSSFAVGRVWLKVRQISGSDAPPSSAGGDEPAAAEPDKGAKEELESDEEYADESDDEPTGSSTTGPATLWLEGVDKKLKIKGRFTETGFIGSDKDKCGLVIKEERAKKRLVEPLHTKVICEDGKWYVEDAGSNFGTYMGLGRKTWFEVHAGDSIMLAGCRCTVARRGSVFRPLQGFIDMVRRGAAPLRTALPLRPHPTLLLAAHGRPKRHQLRREARRHQGGGPSARRAKEPVLRPQLAVMSPRRSNFDERRAENTEHAGFFLATGCPSACVVLCRRDGGSLAQI